MGWASTARQKAFSVEQRPPRELMAQLVHFQVFQAGLAVFPRKGTARRAGNRSLLDGERRKLPPAPASIRQQRQRLSAVDISAAAIQSGACASVSNPGRRASSTDSSVESGAATADRAQRTPADGGAALMPPSSAATVPIPAAVCRAIRRQARSSAVTSPVKGEVAHGAPSASSIVKAALLRVSAFIRQARRILEHQPNGKARAALHPNHHRAERGQRGFQTILEEIIRAVCASRLPTLPLPS